ncbi:MAG TPA: sugar phosphate isomerase/epimerase family protein [Terriglobia bacterium]|jgi:sugar phosphate isomerase/epimerase|nr:sugar phosphate isomerase/epimerase family protein [Terriglobia bacterium]
MKPPSITRREMLACGARLAGAALGAEALWPAATKAATRGYKIGVCDWTLNKRTDPAALEVAKRLGLDGVQLDMGGVKDDLPLRKPELQKRYLELSKKLSVEIASLALGVLNEVPLKSDPRAERWVRDSIDVSKALGTRVVLVAFFGKGDLKGDKPGTDAVVERLKRLAPQAEKAGVVLGFESWLSADEHMAILDRVGSPALKVYYDVGNSHKMGYDIYKEIRFLGKHICEFHAKDYDDLYGKGTINFPEVRRAMDDIGYRGWIQIEGTKFPLGVEESVEYDAKYLHSVFPRRV